ncbi:hypothetical protein RRG08_057164 [Elysia crispata]|uniref:Uncharacterized protein n=1 Tax=Elysia crispata TaxID=231223 RepID=A0AAE1E0C0_9GAST|nr:hypothetical protein RRG08_057164 [Elysia crispata]
MLHKQSVLQRVVSYYFIQGKNRSSSSSTKEALPISQSSKKQTEAPRIRLPTSFINDDMDRAPCKHNLNNLLALTEQLGVLVGVQISWNFVLPFADEPTTVCVWRLRLAALCFDKDLHLYLWCLHVLMFRLPVKFDQLVSVPDSRLSFFYEAVRIKVKAK